MIAALILGSTIAAACASLAILDARQLLSRRALERAAQAQGLHAYIASLWAQRRLSEAEERRARHCDDIAIAMRRHAPRKSIRAAQRDATHRALELAVGR